ncbi:MAG: hypothetical protein EOP10_30285 [Proteobacteria bacterium]|nr:MAG: hypothetical protein EOP10_30285 [Pseudomonadota bacterium]
MKHTFSNRPTYAWTLPLLVLTVAIGGVQTRGYAQPVVPMPQEQPEADDDIDIEAEITKNFKSNTKNNTAEEIAAQRQRIATERAKTTRTKLMAEGFKDADVLDKIVQLEKAKYDSIDRLFEAYRKTISLAEQPGSTDAQVAEQLKAFRDMMKEEGARHDEALNALSKEIDLPNKPRLEAILVAMGITSVEGAVASQGSRMGDLYYIVNEL